jgi:hypothetical protein
MKTADCGQEDLLVSEEENSLFLNKKIRWFCKRIGLGV